MRINKGGWLLGGRYIPPTRIQSQHTNYTASSTWAFTYPATPTQGNMLILFIGGIQSRTVTLPGGWTKKDLLTLNGSNTHVMAYKVADAGESNFNITLTGGTLQGAVDYYELIDYGIGPNGVDIISDDVSVNQSGGSFSTASGNVFTISRPAFVITATLWNDTVSFAVNNSFVAVSGTGRAFTGYRQYTAPISGQQVTWTKSSGTDATATKVNMIQVFGRKV